MATRKRKTTSSSLRDADAHSSITTTMGGWICLCFRVRVFEEFPKAPRVDSTKTTGTVLLPTSLKKLGCTRWVGLAAYASVTTTTTVLTISSAQDMGKIAFTAITGTGPSRM